MSNSLLYIELSFAICVLQILVLCSKRKNRILFPAMIHSIAWGITTFLMILEIKGVLGSGVSDSDYKLVSEYIFYMMISSSIGFWIAHITVNTNKCSLDLISETSLDRTLRKNKWVLYCCFIIGASQAIFLFNVSGSISFSDYRIAAILTERVGIMAFIQRISGHFTILGGFYLMILGYKHAKRGVDIKELLICVFLFSSINISIGGRVWILTSLLPYMTIYTITSKNNLNKKDLKKISLLLIIFISLFSILSIFRTEGSEFMEEINTFFEKFLYFTDGPKIANMVLEQYPPGSYNLEYGSCQFLGQWFESDMLKNFERSIEHDIGLLVTVRSNIPNLYFDFGYWGGILAWSILCFLLEVSCLLLCKKITLVRICFIGVFSQILFQSPIFDVFGMSMPVFEWLIILSFLKRIKS